jgi:hypothetical protein
MLISPAGIDPNVGAPPEAIEQICKADYVSPALFGYVTSLSDLDFLKYVVSHRDHTLVRRIFFSEMRKGRTLTTEAVDNAVATILTDIEDGSDRSRNEAYIRHLFPHMTMQMRSRAFEAILRAGTKASRSYFLRHATPDDVPGIEDIVLDLALIKRHEDALVGIVYRWPVIRWKSKAIELFEAASGIEWLQRKIIFNTDDPDLFLKDHLIKDPITELYVRAKYRRDASETLVETAIQAGLDEFDLHKGSDRLGLVAWCLGHYGKFERLSALPAMVELAKTRRSL